MLHLMLSIIVCFINQLYIYLRIMLGQFLRPSGCRLTLNLKQSIGIRYMKNKSLFDKTQYNPEWIPRQTPYHKHRKPSMEIWRDPNAVGPYLIPPIRKMGGDPRTYVKKVLEEEEKQRLIRSKEYLLDPIRPGDIIQITFQQTYENQALTTHKGFVVSFKRRNSLTAAIQMVVRLGGMNIKAVYLVHSPKIKKITLVSPGSGNFRANLKHNWQKIGKIQANRPRIRNRVMKSRTEQKVRRKVRGKTPMIYNKVKSENVKRIINKL